MPDAKNPELKVVSRISGHFFVPSYQRGYRWGRHEVEALLNDIYVGGKRIEGEKYCLQPVVVKAKVAETEHEEGKPPIGQPYYELIDGQQRLTTLYLLYLYLKKVKTIEPGFTLAYETRPGSTTYLRAPCEDRRDENIDFFHMYDAYQCIEEWFSKAAEQTDDRQVMGVADDIYRYLRNHVYVIWYDAGDEDSIELFTRLNVGRIALTNAELVKALLLAGKGDALADHYRQIEIAAQWDMIEQELQDDAFWAFLTNRHGSDYQTRIELLFDLLAKKAVREKDRFFTFEYFRKRLAEQEKKDAAAQKEAEEDGKIGQLAIWAPVLELYHLLREWFDDRHRYHKVGYLVAAGDRLGELVDKATGDKALTKSAFLAFLDERIRARLNLDEADAWDLDFKEKYDDCERVLLLFNVESVSLLENSTELYPFDSHKDEHWSLEHIHAQNAEPLKTEEGWRSWLQDSKRALEGLPRLDTQAREDAKKHLVTAIETILGKDRVERKDFEPLSRRVTDEFLNAEDGEDEKHSIANLALLSGKVNSALSNGAFQAKRLRVLDLDENGAFIPICTRRVFLKHYTQAGSQQMYLWGREDRNSYLDAMFAAPDKTRRRKEGVVWKYLKNRKPIAGAQS